MDIKKEREAFDQYFKEKYPELYKDVFNEDGDDRAIIGYSFAWSAWQAKAQAVPDMGELQERIAGHQYYHDEHGHMIVDMDDVVKEISGFDSWKSQVVREWFDYTKQSPQMDGNYQIFIKGEQITAKWVSRFGFADPIEGDALRQELITHWAMQPQSPKAQELANESE
ncbi:hypothetical protein ACT4X4_02885 [Acinetobacter baumannii]